jgi:aspartate kinase
MKVLKFGGTSVGSAERIKEVASIITGGAGRKLVVLSACETARGRIFPVDGVF